MSSVIVLVAFAASFVSLPYDSLGPGSARSVKGVVTVEGHPSYPPRGELLYTTVATRQRVNPYEALAGWLDPDIDVIPEERVRGDISTEEFRDLNVELMADSKTLAQVVALEHLGFTDLGDGTQIVGIDDSFPAAALLEADDVIVGVDDRDVSTTADVVSAIRTHLPGEEIRLRLERDGRVVELGAPLGEGDDGGPVLGVMLITRVAFPFEISIDSGEVVGPSAGLAYALELLDILTPGELTGGTVVAVTGDIRPDGVVLPVGGVAQKTVTVRESEADVFLVPRANLEDALSRAGGDLRVFPVDSFADALEVLGGLQGSNALALGQPGVGTQPGGGDGALGRRAGSGAGP